MHYGKTHEIYLLHACLIAKLSSTFMANLKSVHIHLASYSVLMCMCMASNECAVLSGFELRQLNKCLQPDWGLIFV